MKVRDARRLKEMRRWHGNRRHVRVPEAVADFDPARIEQELNPGASNSRQTRTLYRVLHIVIDNELSYRQRDVAQYYYFENMTMKGY